MNREISSESSATRKRKSQRSTMNGSCTMKNYVIHRSLNDDDDFEKSLYKKQKPIPKEKPDATHIGDVKIKKNAGKTVSSSTATEHSDISV